MDSRAALRSSSTSFPVTRIHSPSLNAVSSAFGFACSCLETSFTFRSGCTAYPQRCARCRTGAHAAGRPLRLPDNTYLHLLEFSTRSNAAIGYRSFTFAISIRVSLFRAVLQAGCQCSCGIQAGENMHTGLDGITADLKPSWLRSAPCCGYQ